MMDLTFFTISMPFVGEWKLIQGNAIRSWKRLGPDKIILFRQAGQDKGIREAAEQFECEHRAVRLHKKFGLPMIHNAFDKAQKDATSKTMCFIHAEIIVMDDFKAAVELVADRFDNFLMIGRRWGWKVDEPLDFSMDWQGQLRHRAKTASKLYGRAGLSFFIFNRGLYGRGEVAKAFIGRMGEDLWLPIHIMRRKTVPVIDVTKAVMVVHQNHTVGKRTQEEIAYNVKLVGDVSKGHAGYAGWELTEDMKLVKRKQIPAPKWYPHESGYFG